MNFILYIFIIAALYQILYYGLLFGKLAFFPKENPEIADSELPPVSVIICARNEAQNLKEHIPHIANQIYPNEFEIIIVNDRSNDTSCDIIESFRDMYPYIKLVVVTENEKILLEGKKHALAKGIENAKYEHLVLTDADCRPSTSDWLRAIASKFTDSTQIVIGYSPYEKKNGILNSIIQYETFMTGLHYLSHFEWNIPYMGTGRNISYKKKVYYEFGGFKKIGHIQSGDDDLFICNVATGKNTNICINHEAHCISKPPLKWGEWINQKQRHLSTAKYYKPLHKLTLGAYSATHFLYYFSLFFCCFFELGLIFVPMIALTKLTIQYVIFLKMRKVLNAPINVLQLFLIDATFVFYYVVFGIFFNPRKTVLWKRNNYCGSEDG